MLDPNEGGGIVSAPQSDAPVLSLYLGVFVGSPFASSIANHPCGYIYAFIVD